MSTFKHRGVEQLVARQAHNLEVARSNPASATTKKMQAITACIFLLLRQNPSRAKNKISDRLEINPRQSDYQSCK